MLTIRSLADLPRLCAYCGTAHDLTDEHVIPRAIAIPSAVDLPWMHVFACQRCNTLKSRLDEQCVNLLILHQANADSPVVQELLPKAIRSVRRLQRLDRHSPTRFLVEALLESEPRARPDGERVHSTNLRNLPFHEWLRYLVMGVAMNQFGSCFTDFECSVRLQSQRELKAMTQETPFSENQAIVGGNCRLCHVGVAEGHPAGLYAFQLFGGFGFSVFAAPSELLPALLRAFRVPEENRPPGGITLHVLRDGVTQEPHAKGE